MKDLQTKTHGSLKVLALVCGLAVSGLIIGNAITYSEVTVSESNSFSSLKDSIKKNKNLLVNTYLLGVSIYEEALD